MRPGWTVGLLPMMMMMMMMVLLDKDNEVWMLPAPTAVSMESVNMRHMLRWRPLQAPCNTSVLYSVQFQGEFELSFLNGCWVDAHECQQIRHTHCDLTSDLGSDSDYNLHVRAQCGSEVSAWTELSQPFNRRDTVLTVPDMTVTTVGDGLSVSFDKLPHTAVVSVTVWKKGAELQAVVHTMPAEQRVLHVPALQEGALYCVRARTILQPQLQSASTDPHCVSFTGPDAAWKRPTTVAVTVIIMAGLLFAVFWSISHCRPDACQTYFNKEPLPQSLHDVVAINVQIPMSREEEERCERIHIMQRVDSEHQASKTGHQFVSHCGLVSRLEDQRSELPLTVEFVE